jgi:hypothetical protein
MYEELIKELRYCSDNGDCGYCKYDDYSCECLDHIEKASAEALEDMNRKIERLTEELDEASVLRSFTAEDISEPALIAGRYTLKELTVPNRKRERA